MGWGGGLPTNRLTYTSIRPHMSGSQNLSSRIIWDKVQNEIVLWSLWNHLSSFYRTGKRKPCVSCLVPKFSNGLPPFGQNRTSGRNLFLGHLAKLTSPFMRTKFRGKQQCTRGKGSTAGLFCFVQWSRWGKYISYLMATELNWLINRERLWYQDQSASICR